jgi:hypothetical protein
MHHVTRILFLLILILSACSQSSSDSQSSRPMMAEAGEAEQSSAAPDEQNSTGPSSERRIIQTADYRIRVDNLQAATDSVRRLCQQYDGFISAMNYYHSNQESLNEVQIRVPSDRFDGLLDAIGRLAEFTHYRRIGSEDVTQQYVDVTTRLKTKKEVRDRYIDILRNKAKTVEEILAAEEAIRKLQEEIEAQEQQLKYLQDQTSLSTIRLEMYQPLVGAPEPSPYRVHFWQQLGQSFQRGWNVFLSLIMGLTSIWPLLILLVGLGWALRRWVRRQR